MPTDIVDVSTFDEPVTRPASNDPRTASAWGEGHQSLANRTRWLRDRLAGIHPESGPLGNLLAYPAPQTVRAAYGIESVVFGDPAEWAIEPVGPDLMAIPLVDDAKAYVVIPIRSNSVTEVRLGVMCSAARSVGNRWRASLAHQVMGHIGATGPAWTTTAIGSTDDGGAGAGGFDATFLAWTGLALGAASTYNRLVIDITGPKSPTPTTSDALCSSFITAVVSSPRSW